jgi:hypothetical protein
MNRFLLTTALVLFGSSLTGCIEITPNPPQTAPGGIRTDNVNTTNANSQIRLWILTEEQIGNPPKTKAEASRLENFVQPRFRTFTFNREAGTYFIVASNNTHYSSLADNAMFVAGKDFSVFEVEVEDELVPVRISNTNSPTRLPQFTSP